MRRDAGESDLIRDFLERVRANARNPLKILDRLECAVLVAVF